jgi:hypothetical protein
VFIFQPEFQQARGHNRRKVCLFSRWVSEASEEKIASDGELLARTKILMDRVYRDGSFNLEALFPVLSDAKL